VDFTVSPAAPNQSEAAAWSQREAAGFAALPKGDVVDSRSMTGLK
jgi:hypothetical protein